jgi:UDP-N-acetylmuramoylalanine--D-glutamate ligase
MHATADTSGASVVEVTKDDDTSGTVGARVMTAVVAAARGLAKPGDTVLLAPAGASFDQFSGYADRGDTFAAAVRAAIR